MRYCQVDIINNTKGYKMAVQGKYGWYVCDYETFRMLKALKKEYYIALKQYGRWNRWNNKLPKNRLIKRYLRNSSGQKYGVEIIGPAPKPVTSKIFKNTKYVYSRLGNNYVLDDLSVLDTFNRARMPYKSEADVPLLKLSDFDIKKLYSQIF